jgi:hypothetical protein
MVNILKLLGTCRLPVPSLPSLTRGLESWQLGLISFGPAVKPLALKHVETLDMEIMLSRA